MRMTVRHFFQALLPVSLLGTAAFAPLLTGCPANSCFLEICNGRNCRCSISSCADGAEYNTKRKRCQCSAGYFDIAGQCLDQAKATEYCGPGYGWAPTAKNRGKCVKLSCRPGDSLDERTGFCVPKEQVAQQTGVTIGQGQKLGCAAGEVLVVSGGQAACVPQAQACAKDEVWTGTACQQTQACATGEAFDTALGRCVPYANSGGSEFVVNVQQWAHTTYGPPNGPGTPSFCGSFAKKPLAFGIGPGGGALVRVTVNLSFPGNEVARGQGVSTTVYDGSGNAVPQSGAAEVQSSVQQNLKTLMQGGGRASSETATTTVKCSVLNGSKPSVVPDEIGGF